MILALAVLDVREACAVDPDFVCTRAVIEAWEARHGRIPSGAFVALHTGWAARWPDAEAMANRDATGVMHYPGWGVDALELLVRERGITAIGHDVTDTDPGARVSAGSAPAETYILGADRWQIELLANLDRVPATGALIVATWPKPRAGSGFPARAFAITPGP
jgi:kynurenine formamidase